MIWLQVAGFRKLATLDPKRAKHDRTGSDEERPNRIAAVGVETIMNNAG